MQGVRAPAEKGELGMEGLCGLAGVSRAGYYRHWQASAPRREETGLRDAIQKLALVNRHYGYRRIAALFRPGGWQAHHKRVFPPSRAEHLLCLPRTAPVAATTDRRH